jgi:hypothetical protein
MLAWTLVQYVIAVRHGWQGKINVVQLTTILSDMLSVGPKTGPFAFKMRSTRLGDKCTIGSSSLIPSHKIGEPSFARATNRRNARKRMDPLLVTVPLACTR